VKRWYFPSWSGDYRLLPDGDDACLLRVENPTSGELADLGDFLTKARKKDWIEKHLGVSSTGVSELRFSAPITQVGKALLGRRGRGVITAVRSVDGTVTAETDKDLAAKAVDDPQAEKAVTAARPTLCCPYCVTGPDVAANEVLRDFCSAGQLKTWEEHGYLFCVGSLTGRKYRIAHRHHPVSVQAGKIITDMEDGMVLHAYDWSVPPAEEVLAAKLVLEHREDWIRNASGCLYTDKERFEHPLMPPGESISDGLDDAAFMRGVGGGVLAVGLPLKLFSS